MVRTETAVKLLALVLGLALAAPSRAEPKASHAAALAGYTSKSLEPVTVRARSGEVESGWRLELSSRRGSGAIIRIDLSSGGARYLGEGSFVGWSQERLASVYNSMVHQLDEAEQPTQLG